MEQVQYANMDERASPAGNAAHAAGTGVLSGRCRFLFSQGMALGRRGARWCAAVGRLGPDAHDALDHGLILTGETRPVKPLSWRFTPLPRGGRLELELGEGRSRVVRRLCRALRLPIRKLSRLAYGPVSLGDLPPGSARPLTPREVAALYRAVRLAPPEGVA